MDGVHGVGRGSAVVGLGSWIAGLRGGMRPLVGRLLGGVAACCTAVHLAVRGLARCGTREGIGKRGLLRGTREAVIFAHGTGIEFEVALSRSKELTDEVAAGDIGREGEEFLDVFVEAFAAAVRDGVRDVGNGAGHEGQDASATVGGGFAGEFLQKCDLEVVEVLVEPAEFPVGAVFHYAFDYVPVFVVFETVAWDGGGDRGEERRLRGAVLILRAVGLGVKLSLALGFGVRSYRRRVEVDTYIAVAVDRIRLFSVPHAFTKLCLSCVASLDLA